MINYQSITANQLKWAGCDPAELGKLYHEFGADFALTALQLFNFSHAKNNRELIRFLNEKFSGFALAVGDHEIGSWQCAVNRRVDACRGITLAAGDSTVIACAYATVLASGDATVMASDGRIEARDNVSVFALGDTTQVVVSGYARVVASGKVEVHASGKAAFDVGDRCSVVARGESHGRVSGHGIAMLYDEVKCICTGESVTEAHDYSDVAAYDAADVKGFDKASCDMFDRTTLFVNSDGVTFTLSGNSTARRIGSDGIETVIRSKTYKEEYDLE